MRKGSIFLLLTVILIASLLYLIFSEHELLENIKERGGGEKGILTPDTPRGPITEDCGMDPDCFSQAVKDGCRIVVFQLPDPQGDGYFEGKVLGTIFEKCEVSIQDAAMNQSMQCNLDPEDFEDIRSIKNLETTCSGELLDRLTM